MTKDEALKLALDFLMTRRMGAELVIDALQEALAQPEQEPVAWHDKIVGMEVSMDVSTGEDDAHHRVFGRVCGVMLEASGATNDTILAIEDNRNFTTTPKRPWVELTDEDLEFWTKELGQGELGQGVLRAVADHLKEENT